MCGVTLGLGFRVTILGLLILGLYRDHIGDNGKENGSYCLGFRVKGLM